MKKNLIKKEVTDYGHIHIDAYFNNSPYYMSFDNETEFQAFVYMLSLMAETNASSINLDIMGTGEDETPKENDAKEEKDGE